MTLMIETAPYDAVQARIHIAPREEYVCWSRMQAEAGQSLDAIVERKERERQAGAGSFLWGVGNAPALVTNVLARAKIPVRAVFSVMKTRPKAVDVAPSRTVIWRRYFDAHGVDRPLPPHALVTSRGDSARGAKSVHHALMCRSDVPLAIQRGEVFDPAAFRNAGGTGAPVGSSQVTALLRRVQSDHDHSDYEANIVAWLADSYWVRLTDPRELDAAGLTALAGISRQPAEHWCEIVAALRGAPAAETVTAGALI
jgi:limonene-1,2-epoxide hydrolase